MRPETAMRASAAAATTMMLTLMSNGIGAGDSYYDVPSGIMSGAPDLSTVVVDCKVGAYPPTTPRKITCSFHQALITRRSAAKIKERITQTEDAFKKPQAKARFAALVRAGCSKNDRKLPAHTAAAEQTYWKKIWKACDDKNFDAWRDAELWKIQNVDADTCEVTHTNFEYDFTQQDTNTWVSSQTMTTGCKHTLTLTLWRDKSSTALWNFRQVRSVPPNAQSSLLPGMCQAMAQTPVMDFGWKNRTVREAGCKYFDM